MSVSDKSGILAQITKLFAQHDISIETVLQRPKDNQSATLLVSTHISTEKAIAQLIDELSQQSYVLSTPVMIRIDS
jgi:homoserine dehydrogenase